MSDETTRRDGDAQQAPARPFLRVVRGDATPEELAALVAVLSARAMGGAEAAEPEPPARPSEWAAHHRRMRTPLHPGPGAWRASALPR